MAKNIVPQFTTICYAVYSCLLNGIWPYYLADKKPCFCRNKTLVRHPPVLYGASGSYVRQRSEITLEPGSVLYDILCFVKNGHIYEVNQALVPIDTWGAVMLMSMYIAIYGDIRWRTNE